ncbi:nucleotide-diphospho-sugar transferase [Lipomyces kononenkoae]|uniref:Nucleotide-diphospho-sugar transferase n=1 Tax=Lipomyces kononenkoae TaxID=34357 RepID=A0ACC3SUW6_LIPKO
MIYSSLSSPPRRAIGAVALLVALLGSLVVFSRLSSGSNSNSVNHHRQAAALPAHEVLSGPLAKNFGVVPKLIHQSWSSTELPAKFEVWSRSCREQNPDWQWVLWTDEDNLNLVKKYFPWFLEYYERLPGVIHRADLVRNMYMYVYGGMYADLDVECLRPANELFNEYNVSTVPYSSTYDGSSHSSSNPQNERKAWFGRMGTDQKFAHSIPNAWMAATPGHPFFLLSLEGVVDKMREGDPKKIKTEALTGPVVLRERINLYQDKFADSKELDQRLKDSPMVEVFGPQDRMKHSMEVLPFWNIYPYSWSRDGDAFRSLCSVNSPDYDRERCKLVIAADHWGSYFITYWSHSWSQTGHDTKNLKNIQGGQG